MAKKSDHPVRKDRAAGRRHPLATVALLAVGLLSTGGVYALFTSSATAETSAAAEAQVEEGQKLFAANCATCHGMALQGTTQAPSLIGVGAASVDFQVGTGRMPLAATGPQAEEKPVQFTEEQIAALAAYVASKGPGPGIPSEHLPRLFDRFYKVDPSRHAGAATTGSGLGLSIVRAIVERHGGRITAANAERGGASFEIVLPAHARDRAA